MEPTRKTTRRSRKSTSHSQFPIVKGKHIANAPPDPLVRYRRPLSKAHYSFVSARHLDVLVVLVMVVVFREDAVVARVEGCGSSAWYVVYHWSNPPVQQACRRSKRGYSWETLYELVSRYALPRYRLKLKQNTHSSSLSCLALTNIRLRGAVDKGQTPRWLFKACRAGQFGEGQCSTRF